MFWMHAAVVLAALGNPAEQTVLLDFTADWCGPCRSMDPVVRQLIAQGYPVRQVNVDREKQLAVRFRVSAIPCFVMLHEGREIDRAVGPVGSQRLVQMIQAAQGQRSPIMLASNPSPPVTHTAPPLPAVQPLPAVAANPPAGGKSDAELIAATVRLRIDDTSGRSCGSGTIIDARQGEALILTCGHVFRESQGKGRIEVDFFGANAPQAVPGRLIAYDLQRDVGLLAVRVAGPVAVAPVAPSGYALRQGDSVVTVGCNNGQPPTVSRTKVTSLGKYLGPPNLQVADVPVVGRSGGGLFTPEGLVVGVCNAADPADREGLYAALESVQAQLDAAELAFLYRGPGQAAPAALVAVSEPRRDAQLPRPIDVVPTNKALAPAGAATAPLSPEEQALFDEIHRRVAAGLEVICIVRGQEGPDAKSEVLMLNRAKQ